MLSKHISIYLYILPHQNWHSSLVSIFDDFDFDDFDEHFKSSFRNDSGTRPPLPENENRTNRRNHPNI